MNTSPQEKAMEQAEKAIAEKKPSTPHKKKKLRIPFLILLFLVFAAVAVRFFVVSGKNSIPVYAVPEADSSSVQASFEMLEAKAIESGTLPEDLIDYINSSGDASISINSDGSFSYTESGISVRSSAGLLQ